MYALTISRFVQLFVTAALLAASPPALLAATAGSDKPLYKWVDEKGIVHYGDSIPPQYAKQERSILNRHGVEVGRLDAEKTEAERALDAARDRVLVSMESCHCPTREKMCDGMCRACGESGASEA